MLFTETSTVLEQLAWIKPISYGFLPPFDTQRLSPQSGNLDRPKNGSWNLPFLLSNCVIRCLTWLHSCFASGLSPSDRGFYHTCNRLSVDCGGSILPLEFWSWISSTLTLDDFHCPLRVMNWVSLGNFSLFTCHGVDLPSELLYLFARKFSTISCMALSWLVFSTCILSIDASLYATCVLELDDSASSESLSLLTICTQSTVSLAACYLCDTCCVLTFDTCLDAHCAHGFDDSVHKSILNTVSTIFTLASAIVQLFLLSDLSVTESSTDSTLIWLFSLVAVLAAMLWHDALARVKGILLYLYNSVHRSASTQDFVKSIRATCTLVRSIFRTSGSGRDSRNPPLPATPWHFALAIIHDIFVNLICITCNFLLPRCAILWLTILK